MITQYRFCLIGSAAVITSRCSDLKYNSDRAGHYLFQSIEEHLGFIFGTCRDSDPVLEFIPAPGGDPDVTLAHLAHDLSGFSTEIHHDKCTLGRQVFPAHLLTFLINTLFEIQNVFRYAKATKSKKHWVERKQKRQRANSAAIMPGNRNQLPPQKTVFKGGI